MFLVDCPENATLYTRLKDAQRRVGGNLWTGGKKADEKLEIVEVHFTYIEKAI